MRQRTGGGQDGVAMITVMMIVVVLTVLMVSAIGYATQSERLSRRDQDWNAALAAAQAGINDYTYRLQQDANYYNYSRTNSPTPANTAFTGWQTIPGPANQGQFHYEPVWSASQGTVTLTSTGRVRGVQRTLQAILRRSSFLEYLYLTDFESLDPESGYYRNPTTATAQCSRYWWQGRDDDDCVRIRFVTGDEINGPMHTNDTITVDGTPHFNGKASTGWSGKMSCTPRTGYTFRWEGDCTDRPEFQLGDPTVDTLTLPTTNTAIKAETDRSVGKTGCLYTGPTKIALNASGTMTVRPVDSPFTSTTGAYGSCLGTNIPLPTNGVIYVQNVPSSQSTTCPSRGNRIGYPLSNDDTDYGCRTGDVFVSGTLKGQLTIAVENNIVIIDDITYATSGSASTDLLGLIAANFVQVYHPVTDRDNGSNISPTFRDPRSTRPSWPSTTRSSCRTTGSAMTSAPSPSTG